LGPGGEGQRKGEQQYASTTFALCSPAPARLCITAVVVLGLLRPDFTGHRTAAVVVQILRENTSVYVVAVVQLEPDPCQHPYQCRQRRRQSRGDRQRASSWHMGSPWCRGSTTQEAHHYVGHGRRPWRAQVSKSYSPSRRMLGRALCTGRRYRRTPRIRPVCP